MNKKEFNRDGKNTKILYEFHLIKQDFSGHLVEKICYLTGGEWLVEEEDLMLRVITRSEKFLDYATAKDHFFRIVNNLKEW